MTLKNTSYGWTKVIELDKTCTSIVNIILKLKGLFCESTFSAKFIIAFLNVHTREKTIPYLLYIICMLKPLPTITLVLRGMKSPPPGQTLQESHVHNTMKVVET